MRFRISFYRIALSAVVATVVATSAMAGGFNHKPVRLVIEAPERVNPRGELLTEGWPLTFSMEVRNAVAFVTENVSSGAGDLGKRQALVTNDPDGCLDMRDFDGGSPFPVENCADVPGQDETYFEFRYDPTDGVGIHDGVCTPSIDMPPYTLVDDAYNASTVATLNKAYLNVSGGGTSPRAVGALSGGMRDMVTHMNPGFDPALDCYGFGADIDGVPGLVVWADIGAFKVMDANLNGTGPSGEVQKLRNGAGFITSVSSVLLDNWNRSNVKATIIVPQALFEPIIAIDTDIDPAGAYAEFDYLRQMDDGPIEGFNYVGAPPANLQRAIVIAAALPPIRVRLKAVLVELPAPGGMVPNFITDMNGDGRFTGADLVAEGYTLLSNVATYKIRALRSYNFETRNEDRCPPFSLLNPKDLDGGVQVDSNSYFCSTGNSRSGRRVPR